jgi:probable rRNA maturation factor
VKITLFNQQRKVSFSPSSVKELVSCILNDFGVLTDEVIIHFIGKVKIAALHGQFFNDPTPTDCITFPIDPPFKKAEGSILGETFVCPEVAFEYADQHGKDRYEELSLYVIHTLLHLLGYDDLSPKEKAEMRKEEKRCLKLASQRKSLITGRRKKEVMSK